MDDVWEVTGRHAWDELRPLLDDGVIDAGHYSPSEQCELHFTVFSMHQSATYWDVTLYFVDDAVDADCTCPHGCVGVCVSRSILHDGEGLSALTARVCGSSSPALPGAMRHSSASTRVLVWSRYGASSIQRCGGRGGANSLSEDVFLRSRLSALRSEVCTHSAVVGTRARGRNDLHYDRACTCACNRCGQWKDRWWDTAL